MAEVSKQQLAVYLAAALAVVLVGARYLKETSEPHPSARPATPSAQVSLGRSGQGAFVHVTGAVRRPGVYRLPSWARLDLAVKRAGGATSTANLEGVNLAAKVSDGQQVVVPRRGPAGAAGAAAAEGVGGAADAGPVSLNTATASQLDQLEGVGPVTAQKILDWRRQHGGFRSVDDLNQIGGIGPKRFASLKDKVRM